MKFTFIFITFFFGSILAYANTADSKLNQIEQNHPQEMQVCAALLQNKENKDEALRTVAALVPKKNTKTKKQDTEQ